MIHLSDDQKIKTKQCHEAIAHLLSSRQKAKSFARICEATDSELTVQRRISSGMIQKRR